MERPVLVILVALVISVSVFLYLHFFLHSTSAALDSYESGNNGRRNNNIHMQRLMEVLRDQNQTIVALSKVIEEKHPEMSKLVDSIRQKDAEIEKLAAHVEKLELKQTASAPRPGSSDASCSTSSSSKSGSGSSSSIISDEGLTKFESDCESRYGLHLVDLWRERREVWCSDEVDGSGQSTTELVCYPYHQQHKKLDGRGSDLFCTAKNFVMDFSKIRESVGHKKPHPGHQYLQFTKGSLSSSCRKTQRYDHRLFMPHHSLQMSSFEHDHAASNPTELGGNVQVVETPVYLLARDEDCENAFHSTADFMNMYLVLKVLGLSSEQIQVMLFDNYPDGPFHELIKKAYSPNHPLLRAGQFHGSRVLFRQLIFHLESPAGLIFPKVARPDPLRCYSTSLFQAYRKHILKAFNIWDVPPPAIPTVTLTLRHRTQEKNVGRILENEDEIIAVLKQGNMMELHIVDFAKMTFTEQLKLVRSTNVLVGVHGAGLMLIMFAAEEAVLVEMHPSYRQDRHFRHAARMTGKIYMPLRSQDRETCHGSSDNVHISVPEFRATIDGAVRIARSFDDGLSECGLICPSNILALDGRLDPHYKNGERKGHPINTHFPCG